MPGSTCERTTAATSWAFHSSVTLRRAGAAAMLLERLAPVEVVIESHRPAETEVVGRHVVVVHVGRVQRAADRSGAGGG